MLVQGGRTPQQAAVPEGEGGLHQTRGAIHSGWKVPSVLHLPQLTYYADFKAGNCLQTRYTVSINFFVIVVVDHVVVTVGGII